MKKIKLLLPLLLSIIVLFSYSYTFAQNTPAAEGVSISGDEICGAWDPVTQTIPNPCTLSVAAEVIKGVVMFVIVLALPLAIVRIAYLFVVAFFAAAQGNANAYKEASKKAFNAAMAFFFLVALFGGLLLVMLRYLGVEEFPLQFLQLFSSAFVESASAQVAGTPAPTTGVTATQLPNPVGVTNLYDFLISMLRLVMRFFVYPALIAIWVWTGFSFVAAQGKPEAIAKAKKILIWALVSTLAVFLVQSFLIAARGTVERILPGSAASVAAPGTTGVDGRTPPADGADGSVCIINGTYGQMGTDGQCAPGRGSGTNTSTFCNGRAVGTVCSITTSSGVRSGTCSNNTEGVLGCYAATTGTSCLTTSGAAGTMTAAGVCAASTPRPLVGNGGSCRIAGECQSGYCNANSVCADPQASRPLVGNGGSCRIASECQSNYCNAGGVCETRPLSGVGGTCSVDGHCMSGYCSLTGVCAQRVGSGGTCTASNQCATGYCNPQGRCASR